MTGPSEDDEDWLVGETLDGSKRGGFPKVSILILIPSFIKLVCAEIWLTPTSSQDFVVAMEETAAESTMAAAPAQPPPAPDPHPAPIAEAVYVATSEETISAPPVPPDAPAPSSPKVQPASLPPSTTASPASKTSSVAPRTGGEDDSPAKQSMKDRLAFFAAAQNKPAPPAVKPKPASGGLTWSQRQKLRQEQEAKEKEAEGSSPAPAPTPSAAATAGPTTAPAPPTQGGPEPEKKEAAGAGLSAADAQSSISKGGSLRERMAALQGAGAFGSPAEKNSAPPAPTGKVWHRPSAPEPIPGEEGDEAGDDVEQAIKARTPVAEEGDALAAAGGESAGDDEDTEGEKEKAKRAVIAARMAKLGGRGPIGIVAPPKPAKKPTREAISSPPAESIADPISTSGTAGRTTEAPAPAATSPPTSVPIPSMPRRTAPPRRKPLPGSTGSSAAARDDTAEPGQRFDTSEGAILPPTQVMVADEDRSLPKTADQQELESREMELGRGAVGAEGAKAAGIAIMPMTSAGNEAQTGGRLGPPLVGAVGNAGSNARGISSIVDRIGAEEIVDRQEEEQHKYEEGGEETDDLKRKAEQGDLDYEEPEDEVEVARPQPVVLVPLHPPAEERNLNLSQDDAAPLPPPRMMGLPLDEVEMKHEHDAAVAREEAEDLGTPPPVPTTRPISTDRPLGPRPLPSPGKSPSQAYSAENRPLPAPPVGNAMSPPRDEEGEEREAEGKGDEKEAGNEGDEEEDEAPAPPPPRRQPSMPAPLQMGLPTMTTQQQSPVSASSSESPSYLSDAC